MVKPTKKMMKAMKKKSANPMKKVSKGMKATKKHYHWRLQPCNRRGHRGACTCRKLKPMLWGTSWIEKRSLIMHRAYEKWKGMKKKAMK